MCLKSSPNVNSRPVTVPIVGKCAELIVARTFPFYMPRTRSKSSPIQLHSIEPLVLPNETTVRIVRKRLQCPPHTPQFVENTFRFIFVVSYYVIVCITFIVIVLFVVNVFNPCKPPCNALNATQLKCNLDSNRLKRLQAANLGKCANS